MPKETKCQICKNVAIEYPSAKDSYIIDCPICGNYEIEGRISSWLTRNDIQSFKPMLSHWIRKHSNGKYKVQLNSNKIDELIKSFKMPKPKEQVDNFILWMGKNTHEYGKPIQVDYTIIASIIGATNSNGVMYIIQNIMGITN